MFHSLVQKLASTAIALGSIFFSSVNGTDAVFQNPEIYSTGGQIVVSTTLSNCFTSELDRIIQSGKPVRFYFRVSVSDAGSGKVLLFRDFYHQVRYNLVDHYYQVYHSEHDQTMDLSSLDEVHRSISEIQGYQVVYENLLDNDRQYYIQISAYMEKIQLPGIQEEINLMSYWNNSEPQLESAPFYKRDLAL